jgi:hypothetical protein
LLVWLIGVSQLNESIPMDAVAQLVDALDESGFWTFFTQLAFALNRGRPQEARDLAERSRRQLGVTSTVVILAGIVGEGDSAVAAAGAREYEEFAWRELAKPYPDPMARMGLCTAQLWRLSLGDLSTIEQVERVVFDSVGRQLIQNNRNFRGCAYLLSALAAHKRGLTEVPLMPTDSLTDLWYDGAALVSASIRLERQSYGSALATLRRRGPLRRFSFYEAALLRTEGDLARGLGDRDGAIEAYRKYLRLRSDPEPEKIPERDQVRQALAELVGETGQE